MGRNLSGKIVAAGPDHPIYSEGLSLVGVRKTKSSTTEPEPNTGGETPHPMQSLADGMEAWLQQKLSAPASESEAAANTPSAPTRPKP